MTTFERLLNAQTEIELFVIMCSLTHTPNHRPLRAELVSAQRADGFALELTIRQGMWQRVAPDQVYLLWPVTHIFTLPAQGPLTWQMKDQPRLTGLAAIRERLEWLRESLDYQPLPER
jgi:hypothetical protein